MRGRRDPQVSLLAFVDVEKRIPPDHPLRTIKALADKALAELSPEFDQIYADVGRPSIPPERLLKSSLLIALFSVRSERAFCEELDYNLLFRWFLDMGLLEPSFVATVFTKSRERLLQAKIGQQLFDEVVAEAGQRGLLSDAHFSVDGTLIEAAASLKSFQPRQSELRTEETQAEAGKSDKDDKDDNSDQGSRDQLVDFRGEKRSNASHESTTDPEARLLRKGKGKEAKLVFIAHALMEHGHGLLVDLQVTEASGTAERDMVPVLLRQAKARGFGPKTLAADRGYDTQDCVAGIKQEGVTPHVAQNTSRRASAIDEQIASEPGYKLSLQFRKRIEEIFGWMKTVGGFRRTRYLGVKRTELAGYLVGTAYNLVRLAKLLTRPAAEAAAA